MKKLGYILFIIAAIWMVVVCSNATEKETTEYLTSQGYSNVKLESYIFGNECGENSYDEENLTKYHFTATIGGKKVTGNVSHLPVWGETEFTICEK
jgi:uncharacterized protein (DUF927 family)